jgi:hypothetical protein
MGSAVSRPRHRRSPSRSRTRRVAFNIPPTRRNNVSNTRKKELMRENHEKLEHLRRIMDHLKKDKAKRRRLSTINENY